MSPGSLPAPSRRSMKLGVNMTWIESFPVPAATATATRPISSS